MAEETKKKIITYDMHAGYVDPTPVSDSSTTFEEFIIGAGNPPVKITDVSAVKPEYIGWLHDDPTSAKIDMESVRDSINSDIFFPDLKVTLTDLSTGQYTDHNIR